MARLLASVIVTALVIAAIAALFSNTPAEINEPRCPEEREDCQYVEIIPKSAGELEREEALERIQKALEEKTGAYQIVEQSTVVKYPPAWLRPLKRAVTPQVTSAEHDSLSI